MSKFDDIIKQKKEQLCEYFAMDPAKDIQTGQQKVQATQPQQATQTTQPQQATQTTQQQQTQQTQQQQTQQTQQPAQKTQTTQPQQAGDPSQALAQIFQGMKFSDQNRAVQTLNNAMKAAGNTPGMNEFFSSLGFDPKQGFMLIQNKAQGATPLK